MFECKFSMQNYNIVLTLFRNEINFGVCDDLIEKSML